MFTPWEIVVYLVSPQTEIHSYLANQPDIDRCKRCSLQMAGTLLLSHMGGKRKEPVPPHSVCLFLTTRIQNHNYKRWQWMLQ